MSPMTARSLLSTGGRVAGGSGLSSWQASPGSASRNAPGSPPLVARVAGGVGDSFHSRRHAPLCCVSAGTCVFCVGPSLAFLRPRSPTRAAGLHQAAPSDAARELLEYLAASGGSTNDLSALAGSPPARPANAHSRDAAFAVQQLPASPLYVAPVHHMGRAPGLASPPAAKTVQVGFACGGQQGPGSAP